MRARVARPLLTAIAFVFLAGCATRGASAARTANAAAKSAQPACASPKTSRWREMTWAEYYADVHERAWRNGATVVWITPPRVKKNTPAQPPSTATACAR